jgi:Tol biopolymer transport system component/alpha-beta hydrolase superfamily lysophospholipase
VFCYNRRMEMSKKLFSLLAVVIILSTSVACGKEQVELTKIVNTVIETVIITSTPEELPTETAPPTATATVTAAPTVEPTPTPVPIEVEEITFQSDPFKLVGDLQIPGTEGEHPAIIMVHGDGNIDRYDSGKYRPIMERFLRAGFAVFSWDKPGTGRSTGELADNADKLSQRAAILVSAIQLLKEHPAIDPERIGTWGISQAGYVMPLAMTMIEDISFMIVISGPAMDSYDQGAFLVGQIAFCEGASQEEAREIEGYIRVEQKAVTYQEYHDNTMLLINHPQIHTLGDWRLMPESEWEPEDPNSLAFFNPIELIEEATIPILAIFGEKDRQVDPFQGAEAFQEAFLKTGINYSRVALYPDADHNIVLSETGCLDERAYRVMSAWLKYAPGYLDLMETWVAGLFDPETAALLPTGTPTALPPLTGSGGGVIAFTSIRDNDEGDIYIMNADGSDQRRLTFNPAYDGWPTWSPDGSQIAFVSTRNGNPDIYVMDADGSNLQQLTQHSANDIWPEWSPNSMQIAFPSRRDDNFEIYLINADGSNLQRLTNTPSHEDFPAWSPDGSQIIFSRVEGNDGTYLINADGSNERKLLDFIILEPAWSPDGTQIAFGSDHEGFRGIYLMDVEDALREEGLDGSLLQKLSRTRSGENCPAWSPDGTRIVFASWREYDGEIYVMDADGSNPQKLTDNWYEDEFPAWRPTPTNP